MKITAMVPFAHNAEALPIIIELAIGHKPEIMFEGHHFHTQNPVYAMTFDDDINQDAQIVRDLEKMQVKVSAIIPSKNFHLKESPNRLRH